MGRGEGVGDDNSPPLPNILRASLPQALQCSTIHVFYLYALWSLPIIYELRKWNENDFISAVHIWFISYIINTHFFHGNIWTNNWPAPNVSGFIAQLVEHHTGIARSRVQTLLKSFFSGFFTQLHKLRSLRRTFLHFQLRVLSQIGYVF